MCHGGGPSVGALNGAVMPAPESSGCAGHPPAAHRAAISATVAGSVTRCASPAIITSNPFVATLIVQRGQPERRAVRRVRIVVDRQIGELRLDERPVDRGQAVDLAKVR